MTVPSSIPQAPLATHIQILPSLERDDELWVIPSKEVGCVDLPSLRHLLPPAYRTAQVSGFEPMLGSNTWGAWVLRREV